MTTTMPTPTSHTRGPGLKALAGLIKAETRMVIRDTAGLIVPLGLPLLILVMSASTTSTQVAGTTGLTGLETLVLPLVFALVMTTIGVVNLPSLLAYYRRSRILRRLAVMPVSPVMVL